MVVVPPGSFDMGSSSEMVVPPPVSFHMFVPRQRDDDEGPVHRVTIARAFAVGVYEVTFSEWDACVSGGGCGGYRPDDAGWGRGRRPVISVSWEDAEGYVGWLSRKTGQTYRLLSESEWEYAARAGTTGRHSQGDKITSARANYGSNRGLTVVVGSYPPNGFGLYDMRGNVWEWVTDCWNENYEGAPSGRSMWEAGDCSRSVMRGGSWNLEPGTLRAALRNRFSTGHRYYFVGFRVARTLDS